MSKRHQVAEKVKKLIDDLNKEIDLVEVSSEQWKDSIKLKYEEKKRDLEMRRDELLGYLAELQEAGEDTARQIEQTIEQSWERLKDLWDKIRRDLNR